MRLVDCKIRDGRYATRVLAHDTTLERSAAPARAVFDGGTYIKLLLLSASRNVARRADSATALPLWTRLEANLGTKWRERRRHKTRAIPSSSLSANSQLRMVGGRTDLVRRPLRSCYLPLAAAGCSNALHARSIDWLSAGHALAYLPANPPQVFDFVPTLLQPGEALPVALTGAPLRRSVRTLKLCFANQASSRILKDQQEF